jgi:hypothetical protein
LDGAAILSPNLLPQLQLLRPPHPAHPPCGRRAHTPRPRLLFGRFVAPLPRANGLRKLSFRGAIVPGSSCKQLPALTPALSPSKQVRPQLPRCPSLAPRRRAWRARACSRSAVPVFPAPRLAHAPHRLRLRRGAARVAPCPRLHAPRLNSQLFTRPLFCGWAPCAVAGASLFATPQCGARCALQRGRATTPPRRRLQISGAAGRRCCSHARGS